MNIDFNFQVLYSLLRILYPLTFGSQMASLFNSETKMMLCKAFRDTIKANANYVAISMGCCGCNDG
jgi:hypothetical protein